MSITLNPSYEAGFRCSFDNIRESFAVGDTIAVWTRSNTPVIGVVEFINDTNAGEISFGWAGWSTTVSPKGFHYGNPFWRVQVLDRHVEVTPEARLAAAREAHTEASLAWAAIDASYDEGTAHVVTEALRDAIHELGQALDAFKAQDEARDAAEAERTARAAVAVEVLSRNAAVVVFRTGNNPVPQTLPTISFDRLYPGNTEFLAQVHADERKIKNERWARAGKAVAKRDDKPRYKAVKGQPGLYEVRSNGVLCGAVQKVEDAVFGTEWVGIYNDGSIGYSANTRIDAAWRLINS